jgi:hypothetical protein
MDEVGMLGVAKKRRANYGPKRDFPFSFFFFVPFFCLQHLLHSTTQDKRKID